MKYLIVSDIHGGIDGTKLIYDLYKTGEYDKLLILGDILYHGPRNDLPHDYKPKEVIKLLNELKDDVIAIRGNCDAYVDEMVLDFKIIDNLDLKINDLDTHIEHGHFIDKYNIKKDLIMYGHTHLPRLEKIDNIIYFNPGSITIPKGGNKPSYAVWDNHNIKIISTDGEVIYKYEY